MCLLNATTYKIYITPYPNYSSLPAASTTRQILNRSSAIWDTNNERIFENNLFGERFKTFSYHSPILSNCVCFLLARSLYGGVMFISTCCSQRPASILQGLTTWHLKETFQLSYQSIDFKNVTSVFWIREWVIYSQKCLLF